MVSSAVQYEDGIMTPVWIFSIELASEPMQESTEHTTVVAPLTEREVGPAAGVNADNGRQSMA